LELEVDELGDLLLVFDDQYHGFAFHVAHYATRSHERHLARLRRCYARTLALDGNGFLDDESATEEVLRPSLRPRQGVVPPDRKSTRLNSSHVKISYAAFCLKKKKNQITPLH